MNVLITGAAGGLGRVFALDCAARGYDLLLTDRNENVLQLARKGMQRQYDVTVRTKSCDMTKETEVDALIDVQLVPLSVE